MTKYLLTMILLMLLLSTCAPGQSGQPTIPQTPTAATLSSTPTIAVSVTPSPTTTATMAPTATPAPTLTPTTLQTPTLASMGTANPAMVSETRRYLDATNSFSLVPPVEWVHTYFKLNAGDTDGWFPPSSDPMKINMGIILLNIGLDVDRLKQDWQANLEQKAQDFVQVREDHLTTSEGLPYLRWELTYTLEDQPQHLVYSFYRAANTSLIVVYSRPTDEGSEYDLLADETFKTVKLLH